MDPSLPQKKKQVQHKSHPESSSHQPSTTPTTYQQANSNQNRNFLAVYPEPSNTEPSPAPMTYHEANPSRRHNRTTLPIPPSPLHRLRSFSPSRLRNLFRSSDRSHFPLLALPAELRNQIYAHALTPSTTACAISIHSRKTAPSPLFAVSRQVRHEALDVFYRTFYHLQRFHAPHPYRTFAAFASHLGTDRLKALRQISVSLPAEGYRFDVDEVLATLPQLRTVEGRIDDMFVTACGCTRRIRCRCGAPYYRDWRAVLGEVEEFRVLRELVGRGVRVRVLWKTQERDEEGAWLVRDDMYRTLQHRRWLGEVEEWVGC
ncbi:uncharacterized protein BDZ99DRAFT_527402 [Mytilinidion resinicola]|uniref:F-box domain-containing protein n=1 Tax=Mytilinidion resinicola TaxID=574789 RepID=A0A6A6Y2B7_9PEZI|nr:uncharacterized protein BDZ99DRAFT_527402 [Mytilinidion resinicola]KAF2802365.1 hypothetical protein BDZ99DRAFT_527402 [Mytilinidion resinicola]